MAEFVSLVCPRCGGKLNITAETDRFACIHCGQEQLVLRNGNEVILQPLQETLSKLQQATARSASEQAIKRIQADIGQIEEQEGKIQEKIGRCNDILQAHRKRKQELQGVWITPLLILLFFLGYLAIIEVGKNMEFLRTLSDLIFAPFICWSLIVILLIAWMKTIFEAVFTSGPKPSRTEIEQQIREANLEVEGLEAEKRKKQEEISRHQEIVRQGL
jgi:DNA-directed RNA polymerase subunit RPC12/RpoP